MTGFAGRPTRVLLAAGLVLALAGCSSWPKRYGELPCSIETKPLVRKSRIWWHLFDVTVVSQIKQLFSIGRIGRRLVGLPVRALNYDDGTVTSSSFFTERDPASLTPDEVRAGATRPEDLAKPPFLITKMKGEGKTPGFFVTDADERRYLFKLDPVGSPELLSGAETVTSKLLYALGYHVPSYEVVFVRPDELRVQEGLTRKDLDGEPQPFADAELEALLDGQLRDGSLRVVASKILDGEVLGPGSFKHFRDCTEMRGLKVAYAWVNNIDAKDHNSLLVWNGTKTTGYLIDFGTSLGADAGIAGPKNRCAGWRNIVDMKEASLTLLTLGVHRSPCGPQHVPVSPSVGAFAGEVDPDDWKPYAPNLAFEEINHDDARWIARRMARLSREQVEAAVSAAQYGDPADATYLVEVLEQRREAIVEHYLDPNEKGDEVRNLKEFPGP